MPMDKKSKDKVLKSYMDSVNPKRDYSVPTEWIAAVSCIAAITLIGLCVVLFGWG